jgi:hypothetical protein
VDAGEGKFINCPTRLSDIGVLEFAIGESRVHPVVNARQSISSRQVADEPSFLLGRGSGLRPNTHIGKYPIVDGVLMTKPADTSSLWIQACAVATMCWVHEDYVKEEKEALHEAGFGKKLNKD